MTKEFHTNLETSHKVVHGSLKFKSSSSEDL